jgi:hypothetical protein
VSASAADLERVGHSPDTAQTLQRLIQAFDRTALEWQDGGWISDDERQSAYRTLGLAS